MSTQLVIKARRFSAALFVFPKHSVGRCGENSQAPPVAQPLSVKRLWRCRGFATSITDNNIFQSRGVQPRGRFPPHRIPHTMKPHAQAWGIYPPHPRRAKSASGRRWFSVDISHPRFLYYQTQPFLKPYGAIKMLMGVPGNRTGGILKW